MSKTEDEFAKKLVQKVRDVSIQSLDRMLKSAREGNKVASMQGWKNAEAEGKLPEVMIADCVDTALFTLLDAIDNQVLRLQFEGDDGTQLDLGESQELAGWFIGDIADSWRGRFAKERIDPGAPKRKPIKKAKPMTRRDRR